MHFGTDGAGWKTYHRFFGTIFDEKIGKLNLERPNSGKETQGDFDARMPWRREARMGPSIECAYNLEKPATPATLLIINQINRYICGYKAATDPLHLLRLEAIEFHWQGVDDRLFVALACLLFNPLAVSGWPGKAHARHAGGNPQKRLLTEDHEVAKKFVPRPLF